MKTEHFSLLELLKAREYLTAVMNSTSSFIHTKISKDQLGRARKRLVEIDEELVARLMDDKDPTTESRIFQDNNFEDTLKELEETRNQEE